MSIFVASVQYNDWKGTAAADNADTLGMQKFLRERGLLSDDEFLIGIELWLGEMHGDEVKRPSVNALIIKAADYEAANKKLEAAMDPLPVKQVELDLSMEEFFLLFKRFAISLSWQGLDLTGREYQAIEQN